MLEQVMNEPIRHSSLAIEMIDFSALHPYAKNARRHSRAQIKQIAKSIEAFGFTNPILVSDDLEILAGHGRAAAAQLIGMKQIPIVRLSDLSPAERKAYVLRSEWTICEGAIGRRYARNMIFLRNSSNPNVIPEAIAADRREPSRAIRWR
jgi:hypothetical protein